MVPAAPFDSDAGSLIDRLHLVAVHLLRHVRGQEDAAGVSTARLSALRAVAEHGPVCMKDLAAWERVRSPTMVQVVNDLEKRGQVLKEAHPTDARVTLVTVTAAGVRELENERERVRRAVSGALSDLTLRERASLGRCVDTLYRTFNGRPEP